MWANGKKKDVAEYCLQDTFVTYGWYFKDPTVERTFFECPNTFT
jgi:hypothetical protein